MFPHFTPHIIRTSGTNIHAVIGGSGPPLLLLHGYPQTRAIWHSVAPHLADRFTVVCADLRGYGASGKPPSTPDHAPYSKRAMAQDMLEVMAAFGFDQFAVVGHDRGGRVGRRLALDQPQAVTHLAVLDIVPTDYVYATITRTVAEAYYHWFFLIQPADLPERMIGADPCGFLHRKLGGWGSAGLDFFAPDALAAYEQAFTPAMIHASCEDYRAAATIDLAHDAADRDTRIACPLLILWGSRGVVGRNYDPLAVWAHYATNVSGQPLDCGHYLPEERPAETLAALQAFLL